VTFSFEIFELNKFNQSLSEEDSLKGIECPVCQGICSCSKCRASVLEEDFQKVNELLAQTASKDGGMGNQNAGLQPEPTKAEHDVEMEAEITQRQEEFMPEEDKIEDPAPQSPTEIDSSANQTGQTSSRGRRAGVPRGPYKKHNSDGASKKKSKRGRKRKNRNLHDGSSDSDIDLFNYDKFLKRASKKGTRVHMNVRMYALRTPVEGFTCLLRSTLPVEIDQKTQNSKKTNMVKEKEIAPAQMEPSEDIIKNEKEFAEQDFGPENSERQNSNKDYLHAGEDFYNVDGYEAGRYNLRRRAAEKKYYVEDVEGEGELENPRYLKAEQFKQVARPTPGIGTSGYNKKKRKKKEDDEEYVAEDDDDQEENDELTPDKLQMKNNMMNMHNNMPQMNHQPFGNPGLPQMNPMAMMGNPMQAQMGNQMSNQKSLGMQNNRPQNMQGMMPTMGGFPGMMGMPQSLNSLSWGLNRMPNNYQNNFPQATSSQMGNQTFGGISTLPGGSMGNNPNNFNYQAQRHNTQGMNPMQSYQMGQKPNMSNNTFPQQNPQMNGNPMQNMYFQGQGQNGMMNRMNNRMN